MKGLMWAMSMEELVGIMNSESAQSVQEQKGRFNVRALCAKDVFPMVRIIKKLGLKELASCFDADEINRIVSATESGEDVAKTVGMTVVFKLVDVVLEHVEDVGNELFSFLGGLTGVTADAIAELPLDAFFELLMEVFNKDEFMGFFKAASKYVK